MSDSKLSNFYVRSGLFSILSLVGAVLSYAMYPVLTRILTTQQFGDFAVIVAFSNQLLGILLAFNVISIYLVKSQSEEKARSHAQVIQKNLIWLFMTATVLLLLLSPFLGNLLKIHSPSYFLVLGLILIISVPGVIWTGYLQGHKELVRVGGFNVSAGLGKLVFGSVLAITFATAGALMGIVLSTVLGLLVLQFIPGTKLPSLGSLFAKSEPGEAKFLLDIRGYLLICIVVVGTLSFLQNYDITLSKALFEPNQAGIYSGISVLSNALYFLGFLLIWIVLPEIEIGNKTVNNRVLGTAYKLLFALSLGALAVEFVLRHNLTELLLGKSFGDAGSLLMFATLYQLSLVGITLYSFYLLVTHKSRAVVLTSCCLLVSLLLPAIFANTPLEMIRLLWVSLIIGVAAYWSLLKGYRLLSK